MIPEFKNLKIKLKDLAVDIRKKKSTRKSVTNGYVYGLEAAQREFRHHHIAHCLLRGRKMEEIERPAEGNEPSEYLIKQIMKPILQAEMDANAANSGEEVGDEAVCGS